MSIVLQSEDRGQVSSGHEARPPTAVAGAAVDVVGVGSPLLVWIHVVDVASVAHSHRPLDAVAR